jgi:hypothetical protein
MKSSISVRVYQNRRRVRTIKSTTVRPGSEPLTLKPLGKTNRLT